MKRTPLILSLLFGLSLAASAQIKIDDATADKAKDALDKLMGEVSKATNKAESSKSKGSWERSKENLKMPRDAYTKKATSGLIMMDAEIQAIEESGGAVISRDYYKARLESLKLHLAYCQRDFERLKEIPTEEAFRVKQKNFDRGLGLLSEYIELAKEEAGL